MRVIEKVGGVGAARVSEWGIEASLSGSRPVSTDWGKTIFSHNLEVSLYWLILGFFVYESQEELSEGYDCMSYELWGKAH